MWSPASHNQTKTSYEIDSIELAAFNIPQEGVSRAKAHQKSFLTGSDTNWFGATVENSF